MNSSTKRKLDDLSSDGGTGSQSNGIHPKGLKIDQDKLIGPVLNPCLEANKDTIKQVYQGESNLHTIDGDKSFNELNDVEILREPFKCALISNFVKDTDYLRQLRQYLMEDAIYQRKNNDLYSFRQSKDFAAIESPLVKCFRSFMLEKVLPFVQTVTGIHLHPDEVDLTASKYEYTDVLLCHDDQLEERRVAFILYLVEGWEESFGGTLDLFNKDSNDQPKDIVKRLTPEWNRFVFFEVTPNSFHQVSEIINQSRIRLTVNGWFRGPQKPFTLNPYVEPPLPEIRCGTIFVDEDIFSDWINPIYLDSKTQMEIQDDFTESSEINLFQFLRPEKYEQLAEALPHCEGWKLLGPPNKRKYEILEENEYPDIVKECIQVLTSESMFLTLFNFTGLKLHPLAVGDDESDSDGNDAREDGDGDGDDDHDDADDEDDDDDDDDVNDDQDEGLGQSFDGANRRARHPNDPRCSIQIRQWKRGFYSLYHDEDPEVMSDGPKLDVILHLNHNFPTDRDKGGFISYIAKNDEEDLLVVEPESNFLSLVYMDGGTVRFNKYLNHSHPDTYHDICLIFRE